MADPQLQFLFDYTIFHTGVYITLGTALVGALAFDAHQNKFKLNGATRVGFRVSLALLASAGACAGSILGQIIDSTSYEEYATGNLYGVPNITLEHFEHAFFWGAIAIAALTAILPHKVPPNEAK